MIELEVLNVLFTTNRMVMSRPTFFSATKEAITGLQIISRIVYANHISGSRLSEARPDLRLFGELQVRLENSVKRDDYNFARNIVKELNQ